MTLNNDELKKIARKEIMKNSPGLGDVEPVVSEEERTVNDAVGRKLAIDHKKTVAKKAKVFTFKKTVIAEDGAKIPVVARVTVDEDGNIIKSTGN